MEISNQEMFAEIHESDSEKLVGGRTGLWFSSSGGGGGGFSFGFSSKIFTFSKSGGYGYSYNFGQPS